MTTSMSEQNPITCTQASLLLEKKVADDALSANEQHSLDHHVERCDKCRKVVKWVSALPDYADELTDAEISAAYQTAMRERNRLQQVGHRRKLLAIGIAAAAALAAVLLNTGLFEPPLKEIDAPEAALLHCSPVPPMELVSGVIMTYCTEGEPAVLIENNGEILVSMRSGTVGMQIDPNRKSKRKVTVQTPQGEVRVKGTVFTVEVQPDNTLVEVFRGIVEFVSATETDAPLYVTAGQGADARRKKTFPLNRPRSEAIVAVLDTTLLPAGRPNQATALANTNTPSPSPTVPSLTDNSETNQQEDTETQWGPVEPVDGASMSGRGPRDDAPKTARPVDDLIQNAQSCLISRDWTCAADRYRDILTHYPNRPEATAVLISLAKIELRHLNLPKMALSHYKAYQKRAPNGPMAEEALYGTAETYRKLGKEEREAETLRAFVERYPRSTQIERARLRLQRLQAKRSQ